MESLLTQTLIIHIIRTARIPFIQSRASPALIATTIIVCAVGIVLPYTWAGAALGFVHAARALLAVGRCNGASYAVLTHFVKVWFVRKWGL